MENNIVKGTSPTFKSDYLRLIASGQVETNALKILEVDWIDFFEVCSKDPTFRANIDEARKQRADRWVDEIAESLTHKYYDRGDIEGVVTEIERPPNKDELGRDKLHFEKRKFLAQADNPEKYSQGAKPKISVEFDMSDFKLLSMDEAKKVLHADPFAMNAIEAEYTNQENKDE